MHTILYIILAAFTAGVLVGRGHWAVLLGIVVIYVLLCAVMWALEALGNQST